MNNAYVRAMNGLSKEIHQDNVDAGWWTDLDTGEKKKRNMGELLCLVHSEVSEALEGYRKDLMDDKLTHRKMFEVELADVLIRLFDIAGSEGINLGTVMQEKIEFNKIRLDHKIENRKKDNGKKF